MKYFLVVVVFCCSCFQPLFSQSEGAVSLDLPVRNSLKFNKFIINPTFSFVKEQAAFISIYNKRQWISFENAPQTYLAGYSGRFSPNDAIGLGLFQQNYGLLTIFGAIGNFSHNVVLDPESNFTFGLNVGYFKNGINNSKVIAHYPDPVLETISFNSYLVVNPGINYGMGFIDFGVSVNNLFLYNLKATEFVKNNPGQSIELHLMHTGYLEFGGFLQRSKFTGLLKAELKKEKTILSATAMLSVPKGIWAQIGYNTIYGISGGIGVNISQSILLEYNYERSLGSFTNLGASHEITLAYKFKNNNLNYDEEEESSIIPPVEERRVAVVKPKEVKKSQITPIQEVKTEPKPTIEPSTTLAEAKPIKDTIIPSQSLAVTPIKKDIIVPVQSLAEAQSKKDTTEMAVPKPKDREFIAIDNLASAVAVTKIKQQDLLSRLTVTIANKEKDLVAMKEENDLSEKGIYTEPKPFKSTAGENGELETLKTEIAQITKEQKDKIRELENVYADKLKKGNIEDESLLKTYLQTIQNLKEAHLVAVQANADLNRSLEQIQEATEIERKRRIKRASFMNVDGRYAQDKETLKRIKETTVLSAVPLQTTDFDSGEEQPEVQIVKSIKNVPAGYYVVIAVHSEVTKRDDFLTKTVASGQTKVNFFYDANSSKYFIYYDSFDTIEAAKNALKEKGNTPYNNQMTIVKIEN